MKNIAKGVTPDGRIVEGFLFWMEIDGEVKPCISRSPLKVNDWGEVKYDGDVVQEDTVRFSTGRLDANGRTIYYDDHVLLGCFDGSSESGVVCRNPLGDVYIYGNRAYKNLNDGVAHLLESSERLDSTVRQYHVLKRRKGK